MRGFEFLDRELRMSGQYATARFLYYWLFSTPQEGREKKKKGDRKKTNLAHYNQSIINNCSMKYGLKIETDRCNEE